MDRKPKLLVFSGAGMSAESGIRTFRDHGGLWESHRIEDVATPDAWQRNPEMVLRFYNERRRQMKQCEPNVGHRLLVTLEDVLDVWIITQNIDNLHERAGSSKVLHLHGELDKARSSGPKETLIDLNGSDIQLGDMCADGFQLRPHVVWFGESVPAMETALEWVSGCEVFMVIGSSLQVYPAAGLIYEVPNKIPGVLIDPAHFEHKLPPGFSHIREGASRGISLWMDQMLPVLLNQYAP